MKWSFSKLNLSETAISIWYDNVIDGLDQKSKQIVGVFTHTLIATSPLISLIIFVVLFIFRGEIETKKSNQLS